MPASVESALEAKADRPSSRKTSLVNYESPNPRSIESESAHSVPPKPRWNLAFFGILSYMFVEYTRLPQLYPILQPLQLGKVLVVLTAVGWLISSRTQGGPRARTRSIDIALCAFLAACLGSTLFAEDSGLALPYFLDVIQWAVAYFLISRIVSNSWRMRIFVLLLLLLCLKLSQFEIRDYLVQRAFGRSEMFLSEHGVGAGSSDFFGNGGDFGVAMCVVWPLAGSLLFGEPKKLTRLFLLACFAAFLISIFLCGSRGAILGAGIIALASWATQPKRIVGAVMIGVLALSVYMLPGATMDRLRGTNGQQDETGQMRINLWKAGIDMFAHDPIFGVGLGNFGRTYMGFYGGSISTPTVHVEHSIYVQALAETGLAGTLPLLAIWILFFRINRRTRNQLKILGLANRTCFEYRLSIGLDLALIGYMVSGAFITVLFYPHLWYLLGLCVALHTSCIGKQASRATDHVDLRKQARKLSLAASYTQAP